jgi:hypothetical protein
MSTTKVKETILPGHVNKFLKDAGVELLGSGLDEVPMAYKDIHQVTNYQKDLVEVLGSFMPKIVRMCGDERFEVDSDGDCFLRVFNLESLLVQAFFVRRGGGSVLAPILIGELLALRVG